ncbi:MAG: N-acyl-D-amino-acid deacylase family protein, partial [Flavisolibacter sp.]
MKPLFIILCFFYNLTAFAQQADVLIRNGKILDGTGNSWYYADIAVKDGKILKIGKLETYTAPKIIDAKGLIVAPGFIDVHTHIEGDEVQNPTADNFILDGVTTVVTGNCGSSASSIFQYFRKLDSTKLSINVATLLGHNTVRRTIMGTANRTPTEDEMKRMEELVHNSMKAGAVGISTGLQYIPGAYSKTDEIVRLASVASKYNGVYASHMRDEGDQIVASINETLTIGREASIPVQISHFKLSGQQNWGRSKEALDLVKKARGEGIEVTIDQYPYTASSTSL